VLKQVTETLKKHIDDAYLATEEEIKKLPND
jgi:hypothetical protein